MGSKLALEDKGRVTFLNSNSRRQRHDCVDAKHAKPCSCSSSSLVPLQQQQQQQQQQGPKCKEKLIEFLCSCCLLCVCCPLAAVCCCCIKMPCRMCWKALRRVWRWASCGSERRVFAEYSSFSDIDSDLTYGKVKPSSVSGDRRERYHHLICE